MMLTNQTKQCEKILVDACAASSVCPPWFGANSTTTQTWRVTTTTFRSATGHLLDSCWKRKVQLRDNEGQRVDVTFYVVNDENTP
eukprot:2629589-Amphidinium_carterae.1